MSLRATHYGYAYQDLITGIALVDLMLDTAECITVDTIVTCARTLPLVRERVSKMSGTACV